VELVLLRCTTTQRDQAPEWILVRRTAIALAWDDMCHKVRSRLKARQRMMTGHRSMEGIAGRSGREDRANGMTRQRWPLQQSRRTIKGIGEEEDGRPERHNILKHRKE